MKEYIEREKAVEMIKNYGKNAINDRLKTLDPVDDIVLLAKFVDLIPAAVVVEVRHSYWQCSNVRMSSRDITCRYCHRTETISNGKEDFEYCPHCGAKMDGKDEE